jgi:hypothetical protein
MPAVKEMVGLRFGRLTVTSYAGNNSSQRSAMWLCACDCGAQKVVDGKNLRRHDVQSCGWRRAAKGPQNLGLRDFTYFC